MKVNFNDLGQCGVEQLVYAGTVKYNTTGVDDGVALYKLPHDCIITRMVAVVKTAFNAGTTNVLVIGTADDDDAFMASGDITEGTAGAYNKTLFDEMSATIKLRETRRTSPPETIPPIFRASSSVSWMRSSPESCPVHFCSLIRWPGRLPAIACSSYLRKRSTSTCVRDHNPLRARKMKSVTCA